MKARPQSRFRFTSEPDPSLCASAFCRERRRKPPTHTVTLKTKTFRVCSTCARPWESIRGAKVEKLGSQEKSHG